MDENKIILEIALTINTILLAMTSFFIKGWYVRVNKFMEMAQRSIDKTVHVEKNIYILSQRVRRIGIEQKALSRLVETLLNQSRNNVRNPQN